MQPDRWRLLQELFEQATPLPPEARTAFLAGRCPDDAALVAEVERLLAADAQAEGVLERTVGEAAQLLVSPRDPLRGLARVGKYEIVRRIGEGGFGVVYEGRDSVLARPVAIKACRESRPKARERFLREVRVIASLQHPNITTVHDFGFEGEVPFLVQEYLTGEDLSTRLDRGEVGSLAQRLRILVQVARGLDYAHGRGVLHRDIKPSNVRVLDYGVVKLLDFGIARLLGEPSDLTSAGVALGTVGYVAPELLRGEPASARSDLFSFGVLAYELIARQRPFGDRSFAEVAQHVLLDDPPPLTAVVDDCPPALSALVERCLAREPADRFADFGELLAVLEPLAHSVSRFPAAAAPGDEDEVGAGRAPQRGVAIPPARDGARRTASTVAVPPTAPGFDRPRPSWRDWLLGLLVAVLAILGAVALALHLAARPPT